MEHPPGPPFQGVLWDDDLEKTKFAVEATVRGHLRVERWLRSESNQRILTTQIVLDIHRTIFEDVFPTSAGRFRGDGSLALDINVEFGRKPEGGRYAGSSYRTVTAECEGLFSKVVGLIMQLDQLRLATVPDEFAREVLRVACYVHCEMVRIHPFAGGNGRTSRTLINYFAARYGFLPLSIDRPKGAYIEATQTWLEEHSIDDLTDLLLPNWKRE